MFTLQIDRTLQLMLLETRHTDEVFRLMDESREHLRRYLFFVDDTKTPQDTKVFIEKSLQSFTEGKGFQCGILYKGQLVGLMGLSSIDWRTKSAEIGYWIGEKHQGQGFITRSVKGLIRFAFQELQLNRVTIKAVEDNTKSRAVPERLNFTVEGRLRQAERLDDVFYDFIIYSMLKEEWNEHD